MRYMAEVPAPIDLSDTNLDELGRADWSGGADEMHYSADPVLIVADNTRRAGHAMKAVTAFAAATGMTGEHPETVIGDLLASLRHLSDALRLDWTQMDEAGDGHYVAELTNQP